MVFSLILSALPAAACIWDRDTLREEAKGRLDTVKVITGWFDRYPPRYYEMRLERVAKELESDPGKLDLYDDAGVACDRLGRFDEAIVWMEKKRAVLDVRPSEDVRMDRYRYLANLGSFLGNRWATRPAEERNADPADLKAAVDCIAEAIRLNPDAHFGREKYQLMLFEWLLNGFDDAKAALPNFVGVFPTRRIEGGGLAGSEWEDAESGLAGLIHLGSAWESVDVFDALGSVVQADGASSVSLLVESRLREIEQEGGRSLYPVESHVRVRHGDFARHSPELRGWYEETRSIARAREQSRIDYQEARFKEGRHPDTDPDFWSEWEEREFPALPRTPLPLFEQVRLFLLLVAIAVASLVGWLIWRKKRVLRMGGPSPQIS